MIKKGLIIAGGLGLGIMLCRKLKKQKRTPDWISEILVMVAPILLQQGQKFIQSYIENSRR